VNHGPFDAIAIGAGPAGVAAAVLLARRGHRVLLVDRAPAPRDKLCTHAIMPAGLQVLDTLGVLGEMERAGATRWTGVRLWLNGTLFDEPLPHRRAAFAYGLSLRRAAFDAILQRAAEREPGITLLRGAAVTGLLRDGARIHGARIENGGGAAEIETPVTILAGGRHTWLARDARVRSVLLPNRHTAYVAYLDGVAPGPSVALEGYYLHGHAASLLPADHGLRVGGVMVLGEPWREHDLSARLLTEMRRFPPLAERLRGARVVSRPVLVRGLRNVWREPRLPGLVLVGDAGLQTDPLFGQGITFALRCGAWAAEAIDRGLRDGDLDGALLAYARRRARVLGLRFAGISLFSLVPPGSRLEQVLIENARSATWSTRLGLRLMLGFTTVSRERPPRRTLGTWVREALSA